MATRDFMLFVSLFALQVAPCSSQAVRTMLEYGAIPNCGTLQCAQTNGESFHTAVMASASGDSVVVEAENVYYFIPPSDSDTNVGIVISNINNVIISIEGSLILQNNTSAWPLLKPGKTNFANALHFTNCSHITLTGNGTIQGQGDIWWRKFFLGLIDRQRPTMIYFENSDYTIIERLSLYDSPRFNIYGADVEFFLVRYCTLWINTRFQQNIQTEYIGNNTSQQVEEHEKKRLDDIDPTDIFPIFPIYPFNTNGVDFHGRNIHVHDLNVSNFDDVVAVKSSHYPSDRFNCTENVLVENIYMFFGGGLSIGSVPPNEENRCVRNVTFRNSFAQYPVKLVYIKTQSEKNQSKALTGLIENIYYENISAFFSRSFDPIYIGPQQQNEPDGTGDGYLNVSTEPRVTIRNVSLSNIYIEHNIRRAGLLRCNQSNPCDDIHFFHVHINGTRSDVDGGYMCEDGPNMYGGSVDSFPDPSCCIRPTPSTPPIAISFK